MTEDEVRRVVVYVRSHQPGWNENGKYLYNRRIQLLKGSKEYADEEDEFYIKNFMLNDTQKD